MSCSIHIWRKSSAVFSALYVQVFNFHILAAVWEGTVPPTFVPHCSQHLKNSQAPTPCHTLDKQIHLLSHAQPISLKSWETNPAIKIACSVQQCFPGSGFIESGSGSGSSILGWIPIRIRGLDDQKLGKNVQLKKIRYFFGQILQFSYPYVSIKDAQALGEAFSPKKRTSSTSKQFLNFIYFCVLFLPPGSDWLTRLNPDPIRIRNTGVQGVLKFFCSPTLAYSAEGRKRIVLPSSQGGGGRGTPRAVTICAWP